MSALKIGERIQALRKVKGLSQEALAEHARVSPRQIQRIESGQSISRIKTVENIAAALGCTIEDLYGQATPPRPSPVPSIEKALDLLSKFAHADADVQACVLALLEQDESYAEDVSSPESAQLLAQLLLKLKLSI